LSAVQRFKVRYRSPSFRALRDAGPPTSWLVIGAVLCAIPIALLYLAGVNNVASLLVVPFFVFVLIGWLDRDGWRIRMALSEVAWQQRRRWQWGTLPVDPATAETWLASYPDAPPEVRASVMMTAGRNADARVLLGGSEPEASADAIRFARLRILFAAEDTEDHSIPNALERLEATPGFDDLPADERRYQRLTLAWSIAWLRIRSREPWRHDLAAAFRPMAPFRAPRRYRLFHRLQQYALAIAYIVALGVTWLLASLTGAPG
jgi:hypothetical protein